MKTSKIFLSVFALALCLVLTVGCGPKKRVFVPVEGTLTLDGEPFEGATVCFTPKTPDGAPAAGTTDASGKFTISTGNDVGAVAGDYAITVYQMETTGESVLEMKTVNHFPAQYADPEQSGLTATVAKGMEPLKLELSK